MMPSPAIDARPDTRFSCRLSAGSAQARITISDSSTLSPPIPSRHAQIARSHRRIRPRVPQADRGNRYNPASASPKPRQNPHSARGTAATHLPRFRALALFWTPDATARGRVRHAGVQKTAQERKSMSARSSSARHLGFSKRPARFSSSSSRNMAPILIRSRFRRPLLG
jgi:hypothetical protein